MKVRRSIVVALLVAIAGLFAAGCAREKPADSSERAESTTRATAEKLEASVIRVGYFPNVTHSQALIGLARGEFQKALGDNVKIETKVFNAGPSEIEALFAEEIDIGYIGPGPAINGYIRSKGEALRVIAGATSGGAAFVVRKDAGIKEPADLKGKKLASPQLGNTQDIALRHYLQENGLTLKEKGGDVTLIPVENPDILTLFQKKELDGAWVPEPWAGRLIKDGGGELFVDERTLWPNGDFVTANIIVGKKFLVNNPGLVRKWLKGHIETTKWTNDNQVEAQKTLNEEIKKLTGKSLADDILAAAFGRLEVTWDPVQSSLYKDAEDAFALGFIKTKDVSGIYELDPLNQVLKGSGLDKVKAVGQSKQ